MSPESSPRAFPSTVVHFESAEVTIVGVDDDDHIMKHCRTTGTFYETDLLERTRHLVHEGDFIIDVGANIGNHSAFWGVVCGAQVLAVEPYVDSFEALTETIVANSLEASVYARNYALGSSNGVGSVIPGSSTNLGTTRVELDASGSTVVRPIDSLPEVAARAVRVIKVDVEGMEVDVLRGSLETIARDRPLIFCECLTRQAVGEVESLLARENYYLADVFNYSPTYMFVPRDGRVVTEVGGLVGAQASVGHLARELSFVKDDVRALQDRLSGMERILKEVVSRND